MHAEVDCQSTRTVAHVLVGIEVYVNVTDLIDEVRAKGHPWAEVSNKSAVSIARFCTRKDSQGPEPPLAAPTPRPSVL